MKNTENNFFTDVYRAVAAIPCGCVASYGQIARICGRPKASRVVGYALHVNPLPGVIPCHRVVNRNGRLAPSFAFGGAEIQKSLLENEGVEVSKVNGEFFVDMRRFAWRNQYQ